ncbi:hypothetical protein [Streptomyces ossamyceticus]|uniref:hypothetical protein n=1 Tax=Streptomyces ossamyceticus TaxID=249581 RepID=UPI0006E3E6E1|nr:hypothetical protein [Streptomyces ossamyceticus]
MGLRNTRAFAATHVAAQAAIDAENASPEDTAALTQKAAEKAARAASLGVTPETIAATTDLRRRR